MMQGCPVSVMVQFLGLSQLYKSNAEHGDVLCQWYAVLHNYASQPLTVPFPLDCRQFVLVSYSTPACSAVLVAVGGIHSSTKQCMHTCLGYTHLAAVSLPVKQLTSH